jgi:hypothetical protein
LTPQRRDAYNFAMEGRAKVTKEVLCEEARFILANVMAEARYGRQNRFDDIRRVCEGAVSIPFPEYVTFLEKTGYLRSERDVLEVTAEGEEVVNGAGLADFTERAVAHFKRLRQTRTQGSGMVSPGAPGMSTNSGVVASTLGREGSGALVPPLGAPKDAVKIHTTGGRPSNGVGGVLCQ